MSFVDINPTEAKEPVAVEAGEYELSVISAELKDSKNKPGAQMIEINFRIEGEDAALAKTVRDWLHIPAADDDEATKNRKLLRLNNFCKCFDYDPSSGIETEDFAGLMGKCILSLETSEEFGDQNRIRRYLS